MVKVLRITADLSAPDPSALAAFYRDLFDLEIAMDMGWIVTLEGPAPGPQQVSLMAHGGEGIPVPHLSIEVDDLDAVYARVQKRAAPIAHPLTQESWGVRRFFVVDPAGRILNVLSHD
ncbi:MAG: VOC family protein [Pseudomonadota bacterium]